MCLYAHRAAPATTNVNSALQYPMLSEPVYVTSHALKCIFTTQHPSCAASAQTPHATPANMPPTAARRRTQCVWRATTGLGTDHLHGTPPTTSHACFSALGLHTTTRRTTEPARSVRQAHTRHRPQVAASVQPHSVSQGPTGHSVAKGRLPTPCAASAPTHPQMACSPGLQRATSPVRMHTTSMEQHVPPAPTRHAPPANTPQHAPGW
jgi:hypothetical protein